MSYRCNSKYKTLKYMQTQMEHTVITVGGLSACTKLNSYDSYKILHLRFFFFFSELSGFWAFRITRTKS